MLFSRIPAQAQSQHKELNIPNRLESKIYIQENFLPTQLTNINWNDSKFESSRLDQFIILKGWLKNISFRKCSLKNLNVIETKMENVDFRGADLRGTYWIRSSCAHCDFRGVDLSEGSMLVVKMNGSYFDSKTTLPFSRIEAEAKGFLFNDK